MAHEFQIMNQSGTITTYTSYDDIPNDSTLKHVIKFVPDLGTLVDSNEILLETGTINSSATQGVMMETDDAAGHPAEEKLLLEDGGQIMYESAAIDALGKIVPEDFEAGLENHLVLETASDSNTANHYHLPVGVHHTEGDGHTEEEHREIALWGYRLQVLMSTENTNASSN